MPLVIADRDFSKHPPSTHEILTEAYAYVKRGVIRDAKVLATKRDGTKCFMTDFGAHFLRPDAAVFKAWWEMGGVASHLQPAEKALERSFRGLERGQETGENLDLVIAGMTEGEIHGAFTKAIKDSAPKRFAATGEAA